MVHLWMMHTSGIARLEQQRQGQSQGSGSGLIGLSGMIIARLAGWLPGWHTHALGSSPTIEPRRALYRCSLSRSPSDPPHQQQKSQPSPTSRYIKVLKRRIRVKSC